MTYQEKYLEGLNPAPGDLKANLLSELRSFYGLSLNDDELYEICKKAPASILQEWRERKINPSDKAAVTAFYVDTKLYCYELLGLEIDAPDSRQNQLISFVDLLKKHSKVRGLDYGSGIGTLSIYLNRNGIRCDVADVSETNLNFISERLKRRGINQSRLIHLIHEEVPSSEYDFITAFDVLEHVTDPLAFVSDLTSKLRDNGLFIFNLLGGEENTPHLLRDPNLIRKTIRGFGMKKIGTVGEFKIYQKVNRPAFVNALLRTADSVFWAFREKLRAVKFTTGSKSENR